MKSFSVLPAEQLQRLGVLDWGYTEDPVPASFSRFDHWINAGLDGPLGYLSDHRKHLRKDLRLVFPEFKSALVFLFSYQETKKWMLENNRHEVAAYSLGFEGEDYHRVLKRRLAEIAEMLALTPESYFTSLDAQPVLERDLAYRAGLGWFGKNSMLINQKNGSYFIIGSLLLNKTLPVQKTARELDHCGQCVACIEACPTKAIDPHSRTLIAEKCISTFTIETFKEAVPPEGFHQSRGEFFGCDICQDVCPWNRKPLAKATSHLRVLEPFSFLLDWFFHWPREKFSQFIFLQTNRGLKKKLAGTAFDRPGREGWLKNLK